MYDWVLQPIITYNTKEKLLDGLENIVIKRALIKHEELTFRKAEELKTRSIEDFMDEVKHTK